MMSVLARLLADPPLDPSAEQGRELVRAEMRKLPYGEHKGIVERVTDWINEQFARVSISAGGGLGKVLLLVGAVALVALAIYVIPRIRGGRLARPDKADSGVLEEAGLSAADYRSRAQQAERSGDHSSALLDWFRAIVRSGEERALLDQRPGGTAHELGLALGAFFPDDLVDLRRAANRFDEVRYGGRSADSASSAAMRELDQRIQARRPLHTSSDRDGPSLVAPGRTP